MTTVARKTNRNCCLKGDMIMKKMITMLMVGALALSMLTGYSSKTTGSVSTDGSTSMEKLIGALG